VNKGDLMEVLTVLESKVSLCLDLIARQGICF
jgi:hypothetical protein